MDVQREVKHNTGREAAHLAGHEQLRGGVRHGLGRRDKLLRGASTLAVSLGLGREERDGVRVRVRVRVPEGRVVNHGPALQRSQPHTDCL